MRMLRVAIVRLTRPARTNETEEVEFNFQTFDWTDGTVRADVNLLSNSASREGDQVKIELLLGSEMNLPSPLSLDANDLVEVPDEERKGLESALTLTADVLALREGARREVASPMPCLGLRSDSASEADLLRKAKGIVARPAGILDVWSPLPQDIIGGLLDRRSGVALFAEAQSSRSGIGAFREYARLFENAFGISRQRDLVSALTTFLSGSSLGYTRVEVKKMIQVDRNAASHAARTFHLEADALPLLPRARQAALDVLLNKGDWGTDSTVRRSTWHPESGIRPDGVPFAAAGRPFSLVTQMIDEFGVFILDPEVTARRLPREWWWRRNSSLISDGTIEVRPA